MAAEMKIDEDEAGIKLFGATILLKNREEKEKQVKREEDEDEDDDDDDDEEEEEKEKKAEKIIACPRCKSMDTKFCYFNNYNVNQPRHFCKGCQRYWTAGGALRNVPVGAGRRKTKPPCRNHTAFADLPEGCVFDSSSGVVVQVQQFEIDHGIGIGMVDGWHAMATQDRFRQVLPLKRRRDCQGGQTC